MSAGQLTPMLGQVPITGPAQYRIDTEQTSISVAPDHESAQELNDVERREQVTFGVLTEAGLRIVMCHDSGGHIPVHSENQIR